LQQPQQEVEEDSTPLLIKTSVTVLNPVMIPAFTIISNPINEDDKVQHPDYCPPAEDSHLGLTSRELSMLHKRIQLRRILPCIKFEDLDDDKVAADDPASEDSMLELVDSNLEDVHREVLEKTGTKYMVMDAASFADKVFTCILIALTVLGIMILFWYRNFGPGLYFKHVVESDKY
jgi:hypothetical protein